MPLQVTPNRHRKLYWALKRGEEVELRRGGCLYDVGDPAETVFWVREGHMRLKGRTGTLALAGPGELFGLEALRRDAVRRYAARGGEPTVLTVAPGTKVARAVRSSTVTFEDLLAGAEESLAWHRARVAGAPNSVPARVAALYLDLASRWCGEGERVELPVHLAHTEVAQMIGAHRSTVTTLVNDWIYQGVIDEGEGGHLRLDRGRLAPLAEGALPPGVVVDPDHA